MTAPPPTASHAQEQESFAASLLAYESGVRAIRDEKELLLHCCNAMRRLLPYRQSFILKHRRQRRRLILIAASSIAVIDRDTPMIRWVEKLVTRLNKDTGLDAQAAFSLPAYCDAMDEEAGRYPFPEFLWTPLQEGDNTIGGILLARDTPWNEGERSLAIRFAQLYVHAWQAIKGQGRIVKRASLGRMAGLLITLALTTLSQLPVAITALAPVEVVAQRPFVVTAPFDGVVKSLLVEQSAEVATGTPLVAFEDVQRRSEFEIAEENEAVAKAKYLRASQSAISDSDAKREIIVARAEYELAKAEKTYAETLLHKTRLMAPSPGIALYSDKRDWEGRPVAAGEAIMQIADPTRVRFAIDLPLKESIVLHQGARVKVFLDSDPLNPIEAVLTESGYQAREDRHRVLSYPLSALQATTDPTPPTRIGVQGTAQIYGEQATLIYALLRRPLATLRQLTGL